MLAALLVAIALAVGAPVVAAFRGRRLRTSGALAAVPAIGLALASLVARPTAWGGRSFGSSEDASNAYALVVAALLALMAGAMAFGLAALITRVRRGNAWAERR